MNKIQTEVLCAAMIFLASIQDMPAYLSNDDIQYSINKHAEILEEANISEKIVNFFYFEALDILNHREDLTK